MKSRYYNATQRQVFGKNLEESFFAQSGNSVCRPSWLCVHRDLPASASQTGIKGLHHQVLGSYMAEDGASGQLADLAHFDGTKTCPVLLPVSSYLVVLGEIRETFLCLTQLKFDTIRNSLDRISMVDIVAKLGNVFH